jgi:hypothetical protein
MAASQGVPGLGESRTVGGECEGANAAPHRFALISTEHFIDGESRLIEHGAELSF